MPRENAARHVRDVLTAQGVADAEGRTVTLLIRVDGLVFDRLVGGATLADQKIHGVVAALR